MISASWFSLLSASFVIVTDIDGLLPSASQRYEIVNGVRQVEGAAEEVKSEQGEDNSAEGVFIDSFTETCLFLVSYDDDGELMIFI